MLRIQEQSITDFNKRTKKGAIVSTHDPMIINKKIRNLLNTI